MPSDKKAFKKNIWKVPYTSWVHDLKDYRWHFWKRWHVVFPAFHSTARTDLPRLSLRKKTEYWWRTGNTDETGWRDMPADRGYGQTHTDGKAGPKEYPTLFTRRSDETVGWTIQHLNNCPTMNIIYLLFHGLSPYSGISKKDLASG